ncbi:hypothetical protein CCACVL1_20558 [Corchorus capsularis]|uniref:Uncharacterized protein n=1 Tax=Corchorus capsularis TaxID=210143 RepID=A0A1R3HAM8_COCAP|nr:hypothetical protein CCACVL1_20558 [Corchorus capsularis]
MGATVKGVRVGPSNWARASMSGNLM